LLHFRVCFYYADAIQPSTLGQVKRNPIGCIESIEQIPIGSAPC